MIRALAISGDHLYCLVTPRTSFSGTVKVEWNESKATRMDGFLSTEKGSASQHLQLPFNQDFYRALQKVATQGPVPIKVFCNHPNSMHNVQGAMFQGLAEHDTLLGRLFSESNCLFYSNFELPPKIKEGNYDQQQAYKKLREHRVALVQGLPGSGKTKLMLEILKVCNHLRSTWIAETNATCEMLACKAIEAGLCPAVLLAQGRSTKNPKIHPFTVSSLAQDYQCHQDKIITENSLVILTNTLATTNMSIKQRDTQLLLIDEAGMIPAYRFAGLRLLTTSYLIICGDHMQNPPYKEPRGEFAHLFNTQPHLRIRLSTQYRMPPQISRLSNALAYNNEMKDGNTNPPPLPLNLPANLSQRLLFIDTTAKASPHDKEGHSSINTRQIEVSLALLRILSMSYPLEDIQVLSLYEAHASALATAMLPRFNRAPTPLSITQSQGGEYPVVLLNFVKTGNCLGFPANLQVINVAVSRARKQLLLIADSKALLAVPMWKQIRNIWLDTDSRADDRVGGLGKKRIMAGTVIEKAQKWPYMI